VHPPFGIARFPRRLEILRRRHHERPAILGTRPMRAVADVAQVGGDAARTGAGDETAGSRGAVAGVEEDREARAAIEDAIEANTQLLVADVAAVGEHERLVHFVGLA
jgi:hypothetical protein